jgi:hypothetical protein
MAARNFADRNFVCFADIDYGVRDIFSKHAGQGVNVDF